MTEPRHRTRTTVRWLVCWGTVDPIRDALVRHEPDMARGPVCRPTNLDRRALDQKQR